VLSRSARDQGNGSCGQPFPYLGDIAIVCHNINTVPSEDRRKRTRVSEDGTFGITGFVADRRVRSLGPCSYVLTIPIPPIGHMQPLDARCRFKAAAPPASLPPSHPSPVWGPSSLISLHASGYSILGRHPRRPPRVRHRPCGQSIIPANPAVLLVGFFSTFPDGEFTAQPIHGEADSALHMKPHEGADCASLPHSPRSSFSWTGSRRASIVSAWPSHSFGPRGGWDDAAAGCKVVPFIR
jgi:hypothetical protein